MILPVVKLGTLFLKTACKPIASRLKKEASRHPKFRKFIVSIAQANHRFTTNLQRRIYGHSTNAEIRPLNEEKAVQAAAELLGELFVFSSSEGVHIESHVYPHVCIFAIIRPFKVAGAAIIFEVQRSSRSEARKEESRRQELEAIKQRNEDLAKEIDLLKHKFEELEHLAHGRGLLGVFHFRHSPLSTEASK